MKSQYFASCLLAAASLVIVPGLSTPPGSETPGNQIIPAAQLTYDASAAGVQSLLVEKWRSMGFSMPIDGQTFTWDQYLEPVTSDVPVLGDLAAFKDDDTDKMAGIITYVDAPTGALLVYVPVASGMGQYVAVEGSKTIWLIRPKAKAGEHKI
jgi:hypothetical protein